jgi:micrococcal nuclease
MVSRFLHAALLALAFTACAAGATERAAERGFEGVVTRVADGDSLWVRPANGGAPVELRLQGIDAPEGCQPHGGEARAALARRVLHQTVWMQTRAHDDYQRSVARLRHHGEDVGGWLVREGHAWSMHSRRSAGPYAELEAQARLARRGLWSDPGAIEPRQFRRQHGRCRYRQR